MIHYFRDGLDYYDHGNLRIIQKWEVGTVVIYKRDNSEEYYYPILTGGMCDLLELTKLLNFWLNKDEVDNDSLQSL